MMGAGWRTRVATRLNLLVVAAAGLAVLLVAAVAGVNAYFTYRDNALELLSGHAAAIGGNSRAALIAADAAAAGTVLAAADTLPGVAQAVLYRADGAPLAQRGRGPVPPLQRAGHRFSGGHLSIYLDIRDRDRLLGHLLLRYDMRAPLAQLRRQLYLYLGAGAAAILLSLLIARHFQRGLVRPLRALAEAAHRVSDAGDLSVRVRPESGDEIGRLAATFNSMLEQIQARDRALARAQLSLEHRVEERTHQLQEAVAAAEHAARSKAQFLAAMSHEIRTPLNGVIGMASLLSATAMNKEQIDYVRTIQHSAEALLRVINDVLDFSKIEAGKLELEEIDFSLRDLLDDLLDVIWLKAVEKGLYLQLWYAAGAPERVCGDPGRIRQVLLNFLSNAIKFTVHGGVLVRVEAERTGIDRARFRLAVEDTGIGIAADKRGVIFDEFTQGDNSTTRLFGGTGLGLSISRRLAAVMGGDIQVESALGRGSTFSLLLELQQVGPGAAAAEPVPPCRQLQVLVAGEGVRGSRLTELWCLQWGCAVQFRASLGEAALDLLSAAPGAVPFQLVIVDGALGLEAAEEFACQVRARADLDRLPLVLLAPLPPPDRGEALARAGFNAYLCRPVREQQLRRVLELLLDFRSSEQPLPFITPAYFSSGDTPPPPQQLGRFRVLLVEDNLVNRKVAARMLEKLGGIVDVAVNGREALRIWRQFSYHLVLMDCHMPVMDGYEATREIRRIEGNRGGHVTIVALTANALEGERESCLAAGMDDFIAKPVRLSDLEDVLRRHLDRPAIAGGAG